MEIRSLITAAVADFRRCWKSLMATDILYKLIAVAVLTPLVTLPMQLAFRTSSQSLVADQDIVFFFARPIGILCLIAMGALWISIAALELTALLAILTHETAPTAGPLAGIRFAYNHKVEVLRVTARMVIIAICWTLPFLLIAGLVYRGLLTTHDINYYLQQRPAEFQWAVAVGGVLALVWVGLALRLVANWFFAVALVALEKVTPAEALSESRNRARGNRRQIVSWVVSWLLATGLFSLMATSLVMWIARWIVPGLKDSLNWLTLAIGAALLCWFGINLLVSLLSQSTFAVLYFNLYKRLALPDPQILRVAAQEVGETVAGSRFRLTRIRLLVGLLLAAILAVMTGATFLNATRFEDDVQIIAHRGSSAAAPENTMAAIRQAIKDGTDWVEIDVQETADGEIVVFHDSDFMKLSNNPLKIWDATMADLQDIDIGSWFDPRFRDERVPTLTEVLLECKDKVRVLIELKYYGHDVNLEKRVVEVVEAAGMASQIEVMSLKLDAVNKMKDLRPDWRVGLLMSVSAGNMQSIAADFLGVNSSFVNRRFVRSLHQKDKTVSVWTVNDAISMSSMISHGVDGLITDVPDLARMVLEQRQTMSVAERLMIELSEVFGIPRKTADQ